MSAIVFGLGSGYANRPGLLSDEEVKRHHLQQLQTVVNVQLLLALIILPLIHREERIAFIGPQNQLASDDHKPEPLDIRSLGQREHNQDGVEGRETCAYL